MGYPAIAYRAGAGLLRRAAPGFQRAPASTSPRLPRPWTPPTYRPTGPAANDNIPKLVRLGGSVGFRWREAWDLLQVGIEAFDALAWFWRLPDASGWTQRCANGGNAGYIACAQGGACYTGYNRRRGGDTCRLESGNNVGWFVNRGLQPHPFGPLWMWPGDSWDRITSRWVIPPHPSRPIYIHYRRQWAEPSWLPAWIPMALPPLAPQPIPEAVPFEVLPKLDPEPDFPEMPRRGNEFAPAPRRPEFPWPSDWPERWGEWFPGVAPPRPAVPRPGPGRPWPEPPPAPTPDPGDFPIRTFVEWLANNDRRLRKVHRPRLALQGRAKSFPRRAPGKEKKIRSDALAGLLRISARWQGATADYNDMVGAIYDALPKSCRNKASSRGGAVGGATVGGARKWNARNTDEAGLNLVSKQVAIMRCWDRMDVPKAVRNIARELLEDLMGAFGDKVRSDAASRAQQPKVKFDIRAPELEF